MTRVLAVASEVYPLVKTGGLADVVGALPAALAPHGIDSDAIECECVPSRGDVWRCRVWCGNHCDLIHCEPGLRIVHWCEQQQRHDDHVHDHWCWH